MRRKFELTIFPHFSSGEANPDAVLIKQILVKADGDFEIPQTSALEHDVTGGMLGKLQCGRDIVLNGVPVFLTRAGSPEMQKICVGTPSYLTSPLVSSGKTDLMNTTVLRVPLQRP